MNQDLELTNQTSMMKQEKVQEQNLEKILDIENFSNITVEVSDKHSINQTHENKQRNAHIDTMES